MVTLEPLAPQEFECVAGWLSRPHVNQWLTGEWRNRQVTTTLIAVAVRNQRNRLYLVRHHGEAAGLVALSDIEVTDRTAMVWYVLGEENLAGKGITTEAVTEVARIAFSEMGFASLYAWVMEGNTASRKVLHKAGFREAGRIRHASSFAGSQVDRIYYDRIPSDAIQ